MVLGQNRIEKLYIFNWHRVNRPKIIFGAAHFAMPPGLRSLRLKTDSTAGHPADLPGKVNRPAEL